MNPSRKLALSAGLFALTLLLVAVAAATHSVVPLFAAWVPPAVIAFWVHRRPGPDWEPQPDPHVQPSTEKGEVGSPDDGSPANDGVS